MNFGDIARKRLQFLAIMAAAMSLSTVSVATLAQEAESVAAPAEAAIAAPAEVPATDVATAAPVDTATDAAPAFVHFGPEMIKGQPVDGAYGFQDQFTDTGQDALFMHDVILMPVITVISLFVLALLLWVVARYNKRSNPVPSRTSHNTLIEVLWTVIPVIVLLAIAVPSIRLLAAQYEAPPEDAITIKANGYQWYWGYEYMDNGGFEVVSNMLKEEGDPALQPGERFRTDADGPEQLAADNRMVVPVGVPIRMQTFGKDVIHSFGVPSLWFKIDAVPGRINEKVLIINEPGIYFGQCMELCGARHGYMPIVIEARTLEDYNAWVLTQPGGVIAGAEVAAPAAAAPVAAPAAEPAPAA